MNKALPSNKNFPCFRKKKENPLRGKNIFLQKGEYLMEVKAFFPCERVVERTDGSKDILRFGITKMKIRKKSGQEFAQGKINFFCQIDFSPAEHGSKTLKVSFISTDGMELSQTPTFDFSVPEGGGSLGLGGEFMLKAKESGDHSLALTVGGNQMADWRIIIEIEEIPSN